MHCQQLSSTLHNPRGERYPRSSTFLLAFSPVHACHELVLAEHWSQNERDDDRRTISARSRVDTATTVFTSARSNDGNDSSHATRQDVLVAVTSYDQLIRPNDDERERGREKGVAAKEGNEGKHVGSTDSKKRRRWR